MAAAVADSSTVPDIPSLRHTTHQYGEHSLQRVGVWQPEYLSSESSLPLLPTLGYWIVFIHGGGWRDPRNTLYDFVPSIKCMLPSSESGLNKSPSIIRGFASIDYRLSPHPSFPQDPATTPADELRVAEHPDHLDDVHSALEFLDAEYGLGSRNRDSDGNINRYVLVGHSAGATLAYQLFMGGNRSSGTFVPLPAAIIGIAGIYDLVGLCVRKEGYDSFIGGAFGTDQSTWDAASPAKFEGDFRAVLTNGSHLSILAASPEDTLIDMPETDLMAEKLGGDGVDLSVVRSLRGEHDSIWEDGSQVADLVMKVLAQLRQ